MPGAGGTGAGGGRLLIGAGWGRQDFAQRGRCDWKPECAPGWGDEFEYSRHSAFIALPFGFGKALVQERQR